LWFAIRRPKRTFCPNDNPWGFAKSAFRWFGDVVENPARSSEGHGRPPSWIPGKPQRKVDPLIGVGRSPLEGDAVDVCSDWGSSEPRKRRSPPFCLYIHRFLHLSHWLYLQICRTCWWFTSSNMADPQKVGVVMTFLLLAWRYLHFYRGSQLCWSDSCAYIKCWAFPQWLDSIPAFLIHQDLILLQLFRQGQYNSQVGIRHSTSNIYFSQSFPFRTDVTSSSSSRVGFVHWCSMGPSWCCFLDTLEKVCSAHLSFSHIMHVPVADSPK
jgi:hypothetical protein